MKRVIILIVPIFLLLTQCRTFDFSTFPDTRGVNWDTGMAVFQGQIWSIGGGNYGFEVWRSPNGVDWYSEGSIDGEGRGDPNVVVFNDNLWVISGYRPIGGRINDLYRSPDGINWEEMPSPPIEVGVNPGVAYVFRGHLFLMASDRSIYRTNDGLTWVRTAAGYPTRRYLSYVVEFNHELYGFTEAVIEAGGVVRAPNEIWKSSDGLNWVLSPAPSTFYSPRLRFSVSVYNRKIWVLGGTDGLGFGERYGDIWYFNELTNWKKYSGRVAPPFESISNHKALPLNHKLWIFNGSSGRGRHPIFSMEGR